MKLEKKKLEALQSFLSTLDGMANRFSWIEALLLVLQQIDTANNKILEASSSNQLKVIITGFPSLPFSLPISPLIFQP